MKERMKKWLCCMLTLVIVFSLPSFAHAALDEDVFRQNYAKYCKEKGIEPADGATNMVNIARSLVGKTGKDLGAKGEWCCSFVSMVAIVAGEKTAIPYGINVKQIYNNVLGAGGKKVSFDEARPGDLVIYCNSNGSVTMAHVEIVSKRPKDGNITSIGGNTGSGTYLNTSVKEHSWNKSRVSYILRPKYQTTGVKTYLDKCTKVVSTYVTVIVTTSNDYVMSYPCSSKTDASSKAIRKLEKGEAITAEAIYRNTAGNLWYKVGSGYVYGGCCAMLEVPITAVSGNAEISTRTPKQGKALTISGKVSSKVKITRIKGVLSGKGSTQEEVVNVDASSYSIKGSPIDSNLKFGRLKAGYGYIQLTVSLKGAYINNNDIAYAVSTYSLPRVEFTVK